MSSIIKGLISELNPDLQKRLAARKSGQITSFDKPIAAPVAPASPVAPAPKSDVNPELQKRLAARKAGKPVYSGGLEEGEDRQAELEMALQKARQITKQIKYDDTATDIIVQIQMLAEKFNIDKDSLESAIDDVYNAKNQLESAVYGLDEVFEEALQQSRWDDDEILDENLRKWFKEKWVRFGPDGKIRGACARGDDSEGKPKCLPQSKAHSLGKKGRASAAARKRREDPNPERSGKAINVNTKKKSNEGVAEAELDEACWKGYHKEGNKKMFGKTYPNCVKNTNEEQEQLDEKCWDTHKQVGMKSKGGKMVPNCVPKESVAEEEKKQKTAKALIYQTEVYGAKGYYGQCKEPGCDHKTKTYDREVQAQNAIKKHHQEHFKVTETHSTGTTIGSAGIGGGSGLGIEKSPIEKVLEKPFGSLSEDAMADQFYDEFSKSSFKPDSPLYLDNLKGVKDFLTSKNLPQDKLKFLLRKLVQKIKPEMESSIMQGIQTEYKEVPTQRKIVFDKENPPDLYYLYQQFIQRMLNPENTVEPNDWIDKVNKHYGLNYTWKDYQKRGHNDQTNNWQKIIDKYILKK